MLQRTRKGRNCHAPTFATLLRLRRSLCSLLSSVTNKGLGLVTVCLYILPHLYSIFLSSSSTHVLLQLVQASCVCTAAFYIPSIISLLYSPCTQLVLLIMSHLASLTGSHTLNYFSTFLEFSILVSPLSPLRRSVAPYPSFYLLQ
jgi:hypothetical protein